MNDTASAGGASGASLIPSTTDAFTAAHLVVVAIFALVVILGIVWGVRLKARRRAAERDIATRNAEIADTVAAPAPAERTPPPASPAPIATPAAPIEPEAVPASDGQDDAPVADPIADEPIAASAPLDAMPATEAASAPAAPASAPATSPADAPVGTLKGLGPKLTARLAELGITTVGQVAALTDDEAVRLDAQLGPFAGRMTRDRWIEQARFLAAGDIAGFEAVFGRL